MRSESLHPDAWRRTVPSPSIQMAMVQPFGPDVAAQMAEAFVAAVIGRKREIEAAGGTSRALSTR